MIGSVERANKSRRMSEVTSPRSRKDGVILSLKKSSFSGKKGPLNSLKKRRQEIRRQVRLNAGVSEFQRCN